MPFYIRFARAEVNVRRDLGWVEAARAGGESHAAVVLRYLLPNILPAMAVQISLNLGWAILNAAGLSFIGLGVRRRPPNGASSSRRGRASSRRASGGLWPSPASP